MTGILWNLYCYTRYSEELMYPLQTKRIQAQAMNDGIGLAAPGSGGHSQGGIVSSIGCPYDLRYTVKQMSGVLKAGPVRQRSGLW
jgi:hypothetical protein